MKRREHLSLKTRQAGLDLATWAPGDGATRYRFYDPAQESTGGYFSVDRPLYTALGMKEAFTWIAGYWSAMARAGLLVEIDVETDGEG